MRARGDSTLRARLAGLALGILAAVLPVEPAAAASEPVVAVLPFRVHSARAIDYLGESLANLVQERLAASGELALLDRSRVRAELPAGVAPTSDAELRELALALGAAWLVTGSLTELAGRYSLDVRVTPAGVGARPQTEVLTANDDEELLAGVDALADRIAEHVLGAAPARVAGVRFSASPQLAERLRGLLTTREGEIYDPRSVRDDLAVLREVPDVARVEADTESGPDGVIVHFRVVESTRLFTMPRVEAGEMVAEVRVRGNRRIEADAIRARIGTAPGRPFRTGQIASDVKQIYALSFFRNVRVLTDRDARGLIVIFEVEENPVVRQISISGNESIDGEKIRDVLTLTTGTTLDYPLLLENRARIQTLYRAQGYYLAAVSYEVETLSEASVGIHFIVDEDEKLKLRKIDFVGNKAFSDRELREDFRTKPWRFWSYATTWIDKSGTYSEPLFLQDLRSVEKKYTDDGYLQVEISPPEVSASKEGIEVTVVIEEGPQFRVGAIEISGDEVADVPALRELLGLEEGAIFNRSQLTADVTALRDHYTDRGFFYASVEPLSNVHEQTLVVDLDFNVRKGPLYFIRQIDIAGNTTTVDPVIRREVPLVEGQLYSQRKMALARARIQRLGFFEEVDVQVEPTPDPEQLDLAVSVVEKPTGSFSFGAGFSSQDSFLLNGSLSQSNLFGRGYAVALNADVGRQTQRFFFSFRDPAFLGTDFSLGTTIFRTRLRFESFDQDATGFEVSAGHVLSEDGRSNGFARYNWSSRSVDQDTLVNGASLIQREIFQEEVTTSLIGLSYSSDHRDDRIAPKEGYLLSAALEYAGLGFFSKFLRFEAQAAKYYPAPRWLFEDSTFVLAGRIGWTAPFNSLGDFTFPPLSPTAPLPPNGQVRGLSTIDTDLKLPLTERYFLGGIGRFQLRGFKARSVGPRRPILQQVIVPGGGFNGNDGIAFTPLGRDGVTGLCTDSDGNVVADNRCNRIDQTKNFNVPQQTDVIGGNKFISLSAEYRFPILESFGLQGIVFFDTGNAFAEGDPLYDPTEWRYGTGGAVQWFSPFGPIMLVLGFPLDRESDLEDSPVFEFSVGGG